MSQMSWIDGAIKSLVEVPQRSGTRRIYTRAQLLSYRYTPIAQQWPPSLDKRFSRSRMSRNLQYYNSRRFNEHKSSYMSGNNLKTAGTTQIIDKLDSIKYYDDAIVSACDLVDKAVVNKGEIEKGFYDHPDMFSSTNSRNKYMHYKNDEPEWYIYGPQDVEEEMDFQNAKIYTGDEEKENDLISKRAHNSAQKYQEICETASGDQRKGLISTFQLNFEGRKYADFIKSKTNNLEGANHKGDRPFNIKTLREIESKLKVNHTDTRASGDMTAYYKLLGLVSGKTTENESNSVSDNSQRVAENRFTDHELYVDPAVSDVVQGSSQFSREKSTPPRFDGSKSKSLQTKVKDCNPIDTTSHPTCNPLTASYQRQVIASGPLGQNALRWFKAMTNAASANACITQNLDSVSQTDHSANIRDATRVNAENEEISFRSMTMDQGVLENGAIETKNHNKAAEAASTYPLSNTRSHPELPLYLRSPEQALGSAFGFGMGYNLSPRPMKPLMFYYHPQTAHLFGRPMLHPILLQQLIQRQMDIRTAALQLPFHYLRTQAMVPPLTENYYSALFGQTLSAKLADTRKASYNTIPSNISTSAIHEHGSEDQV